MPKITNIGHKKHTPTRVVVPNSIGIGAERNFESGFSYNLFFPILIISRKIKNVVDRTATPTSAYLVVGLSGYAAHGRKTPTGALGCYAPRKCYVFKAR